MDIWTYIILGIVLFIFIVMSAIMILQSFKKKKETRLLLVDFWLPDGGKQTVPARLTDTYIVEDEGRYLIISEGINDDKLPNEVKRLVQNKTKYQIKKEFIKPKYVKNKMYSFINFMLGCELPFVMPIDPNDMKNEFENNTAKIKFIGSKANDVMHRTKLIKELNYDERKPLGKGVIIAIIFIGLLMFVAGGIGIWYFIKKYKSGGA
jgi:hypothetical protein